MARLIAPTCVGLAVLAAIAAPAAATPQSAPSMAPLGEAVAKIVKGKLPPAATIVAVTPLRSRDQAFMAPVEFALRSAGFAVAADARAAPQSETILVGVTPVGAGFLLDLQVAGERSSRVLWPNDKGSLDPASPVTVRETN